MNLDTLADLEPTRAPRECGVAYALRVLTPDRADVLRRALSNTAAAHEAIARAISAEVAAPVSSFAVGRHRRGQCSCAVAS